MYINKIKSIRTRSTLVNNNNQQNSLSRLLRNQSISKDLNQTANQIQNQFQNINIPQFIKKYNYFQTNTQNNQMFQTLGKSSYQKTIKLHRYTISPKKYQASLQNKPSATIYQLKKKPKNNKNLNQSAQKLEKNEFILSGSNNFQTIKPLLKDISKRNFYQQLNKDQSTIFAKASDFKFERRTFRKLSIIPDKKKQQKEDFSSMSKFLPYYRLPKLTQDKQKYNFLFKEKYSMKSTIHKHRYYSPDLQEHKPIRNSYSPWQNLGQTKGQWQYKTLQK